MIPGWCGSPPPRAKPQQAVWPQSVGLKGTCPETSDWLDSCKPQSHPRAWEDVSVHTDVTERLIPISIPKSQRVRVEALPPSMPTPDASRLLRAQGCFWSSLTAASAPGPGHHPSFHGSVLPNYPFSATVTKYQITRPPAGAGGSPQAGCPLHKVEDVTQQRVPYHTLLPSFTARADALSSVCHP